MPKYQKLFSDAEKQRAYADALIGNSQRSRVPQQRGRITPKMHWGAGAAQLGEALLGRHAGKKADRMYAEAEDAKQGEINQKFGIEPAANLQRNDAMANVLLGQDSVPQPTPNAIDGTSVETVTPEQGKYPTLGMPPQLAAEMYSQDPSAYFQSAAKYGQAQQNPGNMVSVIGPDGKPVLTPERNASGMTPFNDLTAPETDTVNFSDSQGIVRLTAIKGSDEWQAAINDPSLFTTGHVSQRQQIEQGGPGSFDGRTGSQFGSDVQAFQNQSIAAAQSIRTSADLLEIARNNPAALGTPGVISRFGNNSMQTAKALGTMMGFEIGQPPNINSFDYGSLRNTAIDSTEMRSGILNIAFAAAVAEQGSRPSDKDIQAFVDQIAGSTSDPQAFARAVQSFNTRLDRRIRTTARIKGIPKNVQDTVFQELDTALGETEQYYGEPKDPTQLPGWSEMAPAEQNELQELMRMRNGN